ncbi:hypothetical protein, partial [Pelomonas sp. KK5]|uniref:hypothetical protein n=1 Tax=Pelomonas sp. KK5 TaxID=1855730 RepID=UPI0018E9350B
MTNPLHILRNSAGLALELHAGHGAAQRLLSGPDDAPLMLNLFPGNALEGGPANLWLRRRDDANGDWQATPLLGPRSPLAILAAEADALTLGGEWQGLTVRLQWRLAAGAAAWFWHVELRSAAACQTSLMLAQDVGLASPQTVAINEFYVSQYIDWQPLEHPQHGWLLAARQNQAQGGLNPWLMIGSLGRAASFGTDALQFFGHALHEDQPPPALAQGLPGKRLQHEHAFALLEDAAQDLTPGASWRGGFFAALLPHHEAASNPNDLAVATGTLALPEATGARLPAAESAAPIVAGPLAALPMLPTRELDDAAITAAFGPDRLHAEHDAAGRLISFFQPGARHVVLRAKELAVARPHGHVLRAGEHLTPDERALTSTCWMGGVFHSMLTQGHVKLGRMLSTQRGMLGFYRSQGLRAWIGSAQHGWQLLGLPSAFEIEPQGCRWLYAHALGLLEVRSTAGPEPERMGLALRVLEGPPLAITLTFDARCDDDDAGPGLPLQPLACPGGWRLAALAGSSLGRRLPGAALRLELPTPAEAVDLQG